MGPSACHRTARALSSVLPARSSATSGCSNKVCRTGAATGGRVQAAQAGRARASWPWEADAGRELRGKRGRESGERRRGREWLVGDEADRDQRPGKPSEPQTLQRCAERGAVERDRPEHGPTRGVRAEAGRARARAGQAQAGRRARSSSSLRPWPSPSLSLLHLRVSPLESHIFHNGVRRHSCFRLLCTTLPAPAAAWMPVAVESER